MKYSPITNCSPSKNGLLWFVKTIYEPKSCENSVKSCAQFSTTAINLKYYLETWLI